MNQIYTHPGQPQMHAEVVLASQGKNGAPPIYTLRLRYPRIIHAEIMTHRVFSRNARSSRAVPVKTMLDGVRIAPFVPRHWGKNQKGMQAGESFSQEEIAVFQANWKIAARKACEDAEWYMEHGVHKQIPNRLLEPFAWIDTLVTATDWKNFLWLRDHKDAEPHLQDLARLVKQALDNVVIQELGEGDWHMPYITALDIEWAVRNTALTGKQNVNQFLCKISAARCARISYKPFDGDASYARELERYNSLVKSDRVHASPLEHQAKVDEYCTGQELGQFPPEPGWQNEDLRGNLAPGWIQFRKTVPSEAIYG